MATDFVAFSPVLMNSFKITLVEAEALWMDWIINYDSISERMKADKLYIEEKVKISASSVISAQEEVDFAKFMMMKDFLPDFPTQTDMREKVLHDREKRLALAQTFHMEALK